MISSNTPPLDPRAASVALERKLRHAQRMIVLGRLWLALWPPLAVVLLFLTVSLFGLWSGLARTVHQGVLAGFGLALLASLWALVRLRLPARDEAVARVEAMTGVKHRPVASFNDTFSLGGDAASQDLWAAHKERLTRSFGQLRAGWPEARVDRRDPFAVRAVLLITLALGFVIHGGEVKERVAAAFTIPASTRALETRIDAWITPPPYTAKAPVMIADGMRAFSNLATLEPEIEAPENSELVVRINHPDATGFKARLVEEAATGGEPLAPHQVSTARLAEFRAKLVTPARLEISDGDTVIARWKVNILDDRAPSIAVTESVSVAARNALQIKYHVEDDYGVASARALIKQANEFGGEIVPGLRGKTTSAPKRLGEAPVIPLPLPRASLKSGDGQTFKDLTAHPWAGLPVVMTMIAEDQAGQIGGSDAGAFILPERRFTKPLARALIEQRKALVNRPDQPERVLKALEALTIEPDGVFPDFGLYLGVRSVYWRLRNDGQLPAIESAVTQIWNIALKIEDGDLPEAERELREAQERLAKALDENASGEEIQKLMDDLRQALAKFMDAMRENAQNAQQNEQNSQKPTKQVTSKELEKMLKDIEDLAKTGSRDAARKMLSELQQMLENAQTGQSSQNAQSQEMMNQLDELSNLMAEQQKLLDETYEAKRQAEGAESGQQEGQQGQEAGRRGQQGRNGQRQSSERGQQGQRGEQSGEGQRGEQKGASLQELRQRQEALREQLDKLRETMQGINPGSSEKLDDAARSMEEAGQSLRQEDADNAASQEANAVESLREGAKSLAEQIMRSRQGQQGVGGQQGGNAPRDPLGRPNRSHGADTGDSVKVPDEIDIQRAREILDELRRRLGERYRPEIELDYLDRLIKRF